MIQAWNRFWFEPRSAKTASIYRICFGFLSVINSVALLPDLYDWFGTRAVMTLSTAERYIGLDRLNVLRWFDSPNTGVAVLGGLLLLTSITVMIGFFTRTSCFILFVTMVSLHHSNSLSLSSGDTLMRLMFFFMMFTRSGSLYSVDYQLNKRRGILPPAKETDWAFRLIQLQLSTVYVATCIHKLSGNDWVNGYALYFTSRLEEFWRFRIPYIFEHIWIIKLQTWITLIVEFALGTLVWYKPARLYVVAAGFALHLGIEATMTIHIFEWIMIASILVYLDEEDWNQIQNLVGDARKMILKKN